MESGKLSLDYRIRELYLNQGQQVHENTGQDGKGNEYLGLWYLSGTPCLDFGLDGNAGCWAAKEKHQLEKKVFL